MPIKLIDLIARVSPTSGGELKASGADSLQAKQRASMIPTARRRKMIRGADLRRRAGTCVDLGYGPGRGHPEFLVETPSFRLAQCCTALHHDVGVACEVTMLGPDEFLAKAREHAVRAKLAKSHDEWLSQKRMAKSYLLVSKNAEWLRSTDQFIIALKDGERLLGPTVLTDLSAE